MLKKVLKFYAFVLAFLQTEDLITTVKMVLTTYEETSCNRALFENTGVEWLNGVNWIITRFLATTYS